MGGLALYPPHPLGIGGGAAGGSCDDFIINSAAELETLAPAAAGVHTLTQDGAYCWGEFAVTAGNRIVVPTGVRQLHHGHGPSSVVSGNVADSLFEFQSGCIVSVREMTMVNNSLTATAAALETTTNDFQSLALRLSAPDCIAYILNGGQCQNSDMVIDGALRGIEVGGDANGEAHFDDLHVFNIDNDGIRFSAAWSGLHWVNGRVESCGGDGVRIESGAGVPLATLLLNAVEAEDLDDFLQHVSGTVNRASMVNTSAANLTGAAVDWVAANRATLGFTACGNVWAVNPAESNHTVNSPGFVYRGNVDGGGLMQETSPLVP